MKWCISHEEFTLVLAAILRTSQQVFCKYRLADWSTATCDCWKEQVQDMLFVSHIFSIATRFIHQCLHSTSLYTISQAFDCLYYWVYEANLLYVSKDCATCTLWSNQRKSQSSKAYKLAWDVSQWLTKDECSFCLSSSSISDMIAAPLNDFQVVNTLQLEQNTSHIANLQRSFSLNSTSVKLCG